MSSFFRINLDFAGMAASAICAIHCMAMPLILTLGVANSSHLFHDHTFDLLIIGAGIVIAYFSLWGDYRKHRSTQPLWMVAAGFIILACGVTLGHDGIHILLSVLGSSMVASAHYVNWKKSRSCVLVSNPLAGR
ncbi:MAG: MerC domain-containing protein [Saprospiraceae bacterium]|nr:MerC domain-containing protein [Saprospiraceae bacterium]